LTTATEDESEQADREAADQQASSKGDAHNEERDLSFAGVHDDLGRVGRRAAARSEPCPSLDHKQDCRSVRSDQLLAMHRGR
jgi:hypothetical protein